MGTKRQALKRAAPVTKPFICVTKSPQQLQLWIYWQHGKCFWNRYNTSWLFRDEPSSGHAVPTAAECSVMERSSSLSVLCSAFWETQRVLQGYMEPVDRRVRKIAKKWILAASCLSVHTEQLGSPCGLAWNCVFQYF